MRNNEENLSQIDVVVGGKMERDSQTWWVYALLSTLFAALTTIFAKIGLRT
jgi:hypothetical protein